MYPVDLHMHTVASTRAYSTLSDYVAQAKQKGIKLFAITDHGPDMEDAPHHWYFINMRIWPRVADGVRVLRGIETNIRSVDGEINCSGKMFDSLDLIIASFYEPVSAPHDKATNVRAMIATIANGNVHIISHPGSLKYEIGVKAVVEAIARHQVTLEISNSSFLHSRKGNENSCRTVTAAVRDAGGWVTLGSGSHTAFTMGGFEECLKILDAVNLPPERVLDASPRRLLSSLKSRGMALITRFTDL